MKYPVCTLARIFNPGKYCVVSTDNEHVAEVKELEKKLKEEMCRSDTSEFPLQCQMYVAVRGSEDRFQRGVIERKLKEDLYQVLLIDYGQIIEVEKSNIVVITNENFTKVEPLAFVVKLYGLIPTKQVLEEGVKKPKVFRDWIPESHEFVQNILEGNHKVVVRSILIQKRTVFGDLFIKPNSKMKYTSLRKLLCKNEFCVYSESNFLRKGQLPSAEDLDLSNENVELENKMELVKKWQRDNFGEVQKFAYEFPAVKLSPKTSVTDITTSNHSVSDSICLLPGQLDQTSDESRNISEALNCEVVSEKPKRHGMGRGKIKKMIAEIKNKEMVTLSGDTGSSLRNVPSRKFGTSTKVSLGRGQMLKKYFEINKRFPSNKDQPEIISSSDGMTQINSTDMSFDVEKSLESINLDIKDPGILSNVGRADIKHGVFSEFSDSNELTEISFSTEDGPPPLIRNVTRVKKCRISVSSNNQFDRQLDFKKSDLESKLKSKSPALPKDVNLVCEVSEGSEGNTGSGHVESPSQLENFNTFESGNSPWNKNIRTSEFQSNLIKLNNYWTPYVLFDDCVVEPVSTFRELPIQPSIIKNLEKGGCFNDLSQMQRWAIPAIRKQHNTVLIGSSKTGKTLSYIVPLIDYIQDESYFEEIPEGNGPFVVILASSTRVCESIYYMCHSLLGHFTEGDVSNSKIRIVLAHGGGCEKEVWVNLTNGCDILVSTPHCLVRLLDMPVLTNFERLTCLVLDEVDVISQNPFRKSVKIILEKAQLSTKIRHYQKILCGEKWTASVENLVKAYVKSYALVICSYSEAVIYEGLKPSIYLVDQNQKPEILADKLKDEIGNSKILLVCEKKSEACFVHDFLTKRGISSLLAHENLMADKLKEFRSIWMSSPDSIMIITDAVLNELGIREAQTLIHYGLPNKSKTNFYLRYSTLENFLREKQSFLKTESKSLNFKLHDIILVDDENHYQLPHIVDFVKRLGGEILPKIIRKCKEIRRVIEIEKRDSTICKNLLAFGRCRNWKDCRQRHALTKAWDSPENLPTSGWVNFVVLKTHDAAWFSARLIEHIDDQGTVSKLVDHYLEFSSELTEFFKSENNHRVHGTPKCGDICAVKTEVLSQNVFYRAKIIEYLKVDKYEKPLEVIVKLIDLGDEWTRKCTELYELPENLSKFPPTAVDVRVVGVQPLDFDISWSQSSNEFAKELLTRKLEENQYWSGKIVLALNNILFLDPIKLKQYLPNVNIHVFDLEIQNELINNRIAVVNKEHLPSLIKLCADDDIEVSKKKELKVEEAAITQPQWAFFDSDFIQVRFLAAESTSTVFLQVKKFEKLLQELEEDCQKEGTKAITEMKSRQAEKTNSVTVGMFCLALFEDGKWNRGRVESENENEFYVFFVDHGDFLFVAKSDVIPIPQALLLRLPCQAIECRLIGILSEEECPLNVLQEIYSFSEDGKEDLFACLGGEVLQSNITKGRKYSLNLINKKGVSLNKMLVDRGMVYAEESEKENLENIDLEISDHEEDRNDEETDPITDCSELKPFDDCSWENNFSSFSDDVFEDENALQFLREVFPFLSPFEDNQLFAKKVKDADFNSTSSKIDHDVSPEQIIVRQNAQRLLEMHKKRRNHRKKVLELKNREKVLTPQVLWCQNQLEIQMKILLGNVEDYCFECTVKNVSFKCILGEKFYAVDLKLYGAINPQMTKVSLKAFHVLVVLTKLASPLWPRLPADDGKHRWINLDVESLTDKDGVFSEKIRLAKQEIASGNLKKGIRCDKIFPYSDSEDSCELVLEWDSEDSQYND